MKKRRYSAETKVCKGCNLEKDLDAFHRQTLGTQGRASRCKPCTKQKAQERLQRVLAGQQSSPGPMKVWPSAGSYEIWSCKVSLLSESAVLRQAASQSCSNRCAWTGLIRLQALIVREATEDSPQPNLGRLSEEERTHARYATNGLLYLCNIERTKSGDDQLALLKKMLNGLRNLPHISSSNDCQADANTCSRCKVILSLVCCLVSSSCTRFL